MRADCDRLKSKTFVDSHFPDRKEPDEIELRYGLYHEIMVMNTELNMDDLEKAYQNTVDILNLAENDLNEVSPGKPLDRIGIMRLMLSIGCIPYWEEHGLVLDKTWGLGPIVEKWRKELREQGKMK